MVLKVYCWVREMEEIVKIMEEDGGWSKGLFDGVVGIYSEVVFDMMLREEKVGKRKRGIMIEDVVSIMFEGL